jgi:hypothetical protein
MDKLAGHVFSYRGLAAPGKPVGIELSKGVNVKFHLLLCLFYFSVFNHFVILLAIVAGTKSSILVDVLMQIHGYLKGCN